MNLFLIHPDPVTSARLLAQADPVRARKQLLEACQLLAAVDLAVHGTTTMLRADGEPYRAAHPHHPITQNMRDSPANWHLAYDVASGLALHYRGHACAASFRVWALSSRGHACAAPFRVWALSSRGPWHDNGDLVFCRKGLPQQRFVLLKDYILACREYLVNSKGMTLPAMNEI